MPKPSPFLTLPYGPNAWLVRWPEDCGASAYSKVRSAEAVFTHARWPHLLELVPGLNSLLLLFEANRRPPSSEILNAFADPPSVDPIPTQNSPRLHEIPVHYSGEDLARLAQEKGMSTTELIDRHTQPLYTVYLLGFAPGFPYLGDLDPRLHTPRLASPRPFVRAGAVAIGGEHTGIYSIDGPGGWNILGHTQITLFDPRRQTGTETEASLFTLHRGDHVRFVAVSDPP
jgi:KipI family sensor histidine kinase inhibitor